MLQNNLLVVRGFHLGLAFDAYIERAIVSKRLPILHGRRQAYHFSHPVQIGLLADHIATAVLMRVYVAFEASREALNYPIGEPNSGVFKSGVPLETGLCFMREVFLALFAYAIRPDVVDTWTSAH